MTQQTNSERIYQDKRLRQKAYEAIADSLYWLLDIRNAKETEGIGRWSDILTQHQEGIMSTVEAITSFLLCRESAKENPKLDFPFLDSAILAEDIKWIVESVEKTGFRGTPYFQEECDFTDCVSYASSIFLGSLSLDLEGIPSGRIRSLLKKSTEWLLANTVKGEHGVGWSWSSVDYLSGSEEPNPAHTYFTYSGLIALADVYTSAPGDIRKPQQLRIRETLKSVKEFLLWGENRIDEGWIEFKPSSAKQPFMYPGCPLLLTAYVIYALCYLKRSIPDIKWSKKDSGVIHAAAKSLLTTLEKDFDILVERAENFNLSQDNNLTYSDGTTPYTVLMAIAEYLEVYAEELQDQRERFELMQARVAEAILSDDKKFWAGAGGLSRQGFRHIAAAEKSRVVVVYATSAAIEALLRFGVEPSPPELSLVSIIQEELNIAQEHITKRIQKFALKGVEDKRAKSLANDFESTLEGLFDFIETNGIMAVLLKATCADMTPSEMQKWQEYGPQATNEFISLLRAVTRHDNIGDFNRRVEDYEKDWGKYLFLPIRQTLGELKRIDERTWSDHFSRYSRLQAIVFYLRSKLSGGDR